MRLVKVISGGQNGVDVAALRAAKRAGLETGGAMPRGYRTLDGPRPGYREEFGLQEHSSPGYPLRTAKNVRDADATLRVAANFDSAGERCTWAAIVRYRKPHLDVQVDVDPLRLRDRSWTELTVLSETEPRPDAVARWLAEHGFAVLNVAGNSERTTPGIEAFADRYLTAVIACLRSPWSPWNGELATEPTKTQRSETE